MSINNAVAMNTKIKTVTGDLSIAKILEKKGYCLLALFTTPLETEIDVLDLGINVITGTTETSLLQTITIKGMLQTVTLDVFGSWSLICDKEAHVLDNNNNAVVVGDLMSGSKIKSRDVLSVSNRTGSVFCVTIKTSASDYIVLGNDIYLST
jgi:hypothetical protein